MYRIFVAGIFPAVESNSLTAYWAMQQVDQTSSYQGRRSISSGFWEHHLAQIRD